MAGRAKDGKPDARGRDVLEEALEHKPSKPFADSSEFDHAAEAHSTPKSSGRDVRRMVEDIVVTPFFKHHGGHMPATIKLHAELREEKGHIILEASVPGFEEDEVKVEAGINSIDVSLLMDKREVGEEDDVYFHNSYVTPKPIDAEKLHVEHKGGIIRIKAPIRK